MQNFTTEALQAAQKAVLSTLHKNEKVCETLSAKQAVHTVQWDTARAQCAVFSTVATLLASALGQCPDAPPQAILTRHSLEQAAKALPPLIAKVEAFIPKFQPGTPQHTLAVRRVAAFQISLALVKAQLNETTSTDCGHVKASQ